MLLPEFMRHSNFFYMFQDDHKSSYDLSPHKVTNYLSSIFSTLYIPYLQLIYFATKACTSLISFIYFFPPPISPPLLTTYSLNL